MSCSNLYYMRLYRDLLRSTIPERKNSRLRRYLISPDKSRRRYCCEEKSGLKITKRVLPLVNFQSFIT